MKVKGKAVVDVLGGRLGEAGGAGIQVFLFMVVGWGGVGWAVGQAATYETIAPYSFALFLFTLVVWVIAVHLLSKQIKKANKLAGEID
jgi:AAA family ATP:ADP antiporter